MPVPVRWQCGATGGSAATRITAGLVAHNARFIDPIFSSGVFLSMKTAFLVAPAVHRQLTEPLNGDNEELAKAYRKVTGRAAQAHRLGVPRAVGRGVRRDGGHGRPAGERVGRRVIRPPPQGVWRRCNTCGWYRTFPVFRSLHPSPPPVSLLTTPGRRTKLRGQALRRGQPWPLVPDS